MADVDDALELLRSSDWEQRVKAVRRLLEIDDPRAVEGLERALGDSQNTAVIEAAAVALLERFDGPSMQALTRAARSSDFEVSQTVADVLLGAAERGRFAARLLKG